MSPAHATDACLYDADAIWVGLLLFPARECGGACGEKLPRNSDYFTPDSRAADGLRTVCRRCRRKQGRDNERARVAARRAARAAQT